MTTPSDAPRPGSWLVAGPPSEQGAATPADGAPAAADDLAGRLAELPVAAHADVLDAEHARLHRLLATIDQL